MGSNIPGHVRLKGLPEVFSVNTLSRHMDMPKPVALAYLRRWKARGWVEQAGPRSGIYFNLVANPSAVEVHRVDALRMQYPSATLCGESVLHACGWTTQTPRAMHVAIERRRSYVRLAGFELHPKPLAWYVAARIMAPEKAKFTTYGLRSLLPAWALADLYATDGAWKPDPDDLDIPQSAYKELTRAFEDLNCEPPGWLSGRIAFDRPG